MWFFFFFLLSFPADYQLDILCIVYSCCLLVRLLCVTLNIDQSINQYECFRQVELHGGDRALANGHIYSMVGLDMHVVVKYLESNDDTGKCTCPPVLTLFSTIYSPTVLQIFNQFVHFYYYAYYRSIYNGKLTRWWDYAMCDAKKSQLAYCSNDSLVTIATALFTSVSGRNRRVPNAMSGISGYRGAGRWYRLIRRMWFPSSEIAWTVSEILKPKYRAPHF